MITPLEIHKQWDGGDPSLFIRFPIALLESYGLESNDCKFQWDTGFPEWAAPNMHFFFSGGDTLPTLCDSFDNPLLGIPESWGQIGNTGEGWPIYLDANGLGKVYCLRTEANRHSQLLNSSITQLLSTLFEFNKTVSEALAYGKKHKHKDAWRRRLYPPEIDLNLQNKIRSIDPDAMSSNGYWPWYFLHRD